MASTHGNLTRYLSIRKLRIKEVHLDHNENLLAEGQYKAVNVLNLPPRGAESVAGGHRFYQFVG
jgi:hypothetical protein